MIHNNFLKSNLIWSKKDQRAVDTSKILAAEAVENIGNGHPGTAISLAPLAYILYHKIMRHDPNDPCWNGRDKFILSAGHASLLMYVQLFLSGYNVNIDDLKSLRTLGSKTPGHPEYKITPGVEMTTGPLGQGLASAVGFAYSQRYIQEIFKSQLSDKLFNHNIWVIVSDGDLQEGVSSEASSLAGHQELGNLIVIYDDNHISIEGDTKISFSENVQARYKSYGWHVQSVNWLNNNKYEENVHELYKKLLIAKNETKRPSLISLRTIIGWPSIKQNTGIVHGAALGKEAVIDLKKRLKFDLNKKFFIEKEIFDHTLKTKEKGRLIHEQWNANYNLWKTKNLNQFNLYKRLKNKTLPKNWYANLPKFKNNVEVSTRVASGKIINKISEVLPEFWGGSADLAESNNTTIYNKPSFIPNTKITKEWKYASYLGKNLHFGIREHAAAAIVNGIVLDGYTRAFSGTFLTFSDYQRPAIRLSALMKIPSIYVWTHDSIGLGEDGPTHQPIEHLASLRAIPNLSIVRPGDANETIEAWKNIIIRNKNGPIGLVLTRQNLPNWKRGKLNYPVDTEFTNAKFVKNGGYIFIEAKNYKPQIILITSGSELQIAVKARSILQKKYSIGTRIVSMPCLEWFMNQEKNYKDKILPKNIKRISIEAGISLSWHKLINNHGCSISIENYGASGNCKALYNYFNITAENVVKNAKKILSVK